MGFFLKSALRFKQRTLAGNILLQGSISAFLIQIIGTAFKYVFQIFMARWMGVTEYGTFNYVYNLVLLLATFSGLGLTSAAIRFVPEYNALKKWQALKGFIARSSQIIFVGGVIFALIGICIVWKNGKEGFAGTSLILGLLTIPFLGLATHQSQILRGMKDVVISLTPLRVIQPILAFAVFALLRILGWISSTSALIAFMASVLFVLLLHFFGMRWVLPKEIKFIKPQFDNSTWFKVSIPMLITTIGYSIISQIDIVMIGFFLEPAQVGIYAAAAKTSSLVSFLLVSVNTIVAPIISEMFYLNEKDKLMDVIQSARYWMFIPVLATTVFLALFGKNILNLFGADFAEGYWPLMILVSGQLVNALTGPVGYVTELTGHQNYSAIVYVISAVVCVALNLLLIPRFGILGAAFSTAAAVIFNNLWFYGFVNSNIFKKD